jgi:hypothetical protein
MKFLSRSFNNESTSATGKHFSGMTILDYGFLAQIVYLDSEAEIEDAVNTFFYKDGGNTKSIEGVYRPRIPRSTTTHGDLYRRLVWTEVGISWHELLCRFVFNTESKLHGIPDIISN